MNLLHPCLDSKCNISDFFFFIFFIDKDTLSTRKNDKKDGGLDIFTKKKKEKYRKGERPAILGKE